MRVAVLAAKAYTALALRDYIPAGAFANELLARLNCLSIFSQSNFTITIYQLSGRVCQAVTSFLHTSTQQKVLFFKTRWACTMFVTAASGGNRAMRHGW